MVLYEISRRICGLFCFFSRKERISSIDWLRYSQNEITLQDMAAKYFAFTELR